MSVSDDAVLATMRQFRDTLQSLRGLYLDSGELVAQRYQHLLDGEPQDFPDEMDQLHRGLAMKLYQAVCPVGAEPSLESRQLGRVLLEHLWGRPVMGAGLHEAMEWLAVEAEKLRWSECVQPFATLPPLRERWGELISTAMRLANLAAKADGTVGPTEADRLRSIQEELDAAGRHEAARFSQAAAREKQAVIDTQRSAERMRDPESTKPIPVRPSPETAQRRPGAQPTREQRPPDRGRDGHRRAEPAESTEDRPTDEFQPGKGSNVAVTPAPDSVDDGRTPEQRLADALKKLDELVGLDVIKQQIRTLTNFLKLEERRKAEGLPSTRPSLHMVFVGNPGTGKTTVARSVAEIFGALGILKKGHLVETDRSGLVAEYAGQTGPKTNALIDEALDGVLFIDEAYSLVDTQGGQDQYGREAIQTLLKRMEDQRDRLVVILAGYPREIEAMLMSNPGLKSRVGQILEFEDYTPGELAQIFGLMSGKAEYRLPTESRRRILKAFTYLYATRDRHFGNGRAVRNTFEASIKQLANRLADVAPITRELLSTLEPEDIVVPGIGAAHLAALAALPGRVLTNCPACKEPADFDDKLVGTKVSCPHCQKEIALDWGEPIPPEMAQDGQPAAASTLATADHANHGSTEGAASTSSGAEPSSGAPPATVNRPTS
jgi:adenylate kinase family enzyme